MPETIEGQVVVDKNGQQYVINYRQIDKTGSTTVGTPEISINIVKITANGTATDITGQKDRMKVRRTIWGQISEATGMRVRVVIRWGLSGERHFNPGRIGNVVVEDPSTVKGITGGGIGKDEGIYI